MKRDKIIYWTATGLLSVAMIASSFMYLSKNPALLSSFKAAGYPDYFIPLLGAAKLLGAIMLVVPKWDRLKEWAYAGFTFTFIGATWTHMATNTPFIAPLVILLILGVSYWFYRRLAVRGQVQEKRI